MAIANRRERGFWSWLGNLYGFALIGVTLIAVLICIIIGGTFIRSAPNESVLPNFLQKLPGISKVYAADGTLLGEFAAERRIIVRYRDIPPKLIQAFLAIEDHRFFEHKGIDWYATSRALAADIAAGDIVQGGSTITQQLAKAVIRSPDLIESKAHEAVLARKFERIYTKEQILEAYLNIIYLGSGAYGVVVAAERYFAKSLAELSLAEMALIAGLPRAPSVTNPYANMERAVDRRNVVLRRMAELGYVTQQQADDAIGQAIDLRAPQSIYPRRSPYYAEYLRAYAEKTYGKTALLRGALRVEGAVEPAYDAMAYANVDFAARKQDKRQGWRGPEAFLEGRAAQVFLERATDRYGDGPLEDGRRYLALVREVSGDQAVVAIGQRDYHLPLRNMKWASRWRAGEYETNEDEIESARAALKPGYVVWVAKETWGRQRFWDWFLDGEKKNPRWRSQLSPEQYKRKFRPTKGDVTLEQRPHPQAALVSMDHTSGYVHAMVGGYDFQRNQYNRAAKACRQPGSTYKAIYYSKALDEGFGFETKLLNKTKSHVDPANGRRYVVYNFGGDSHPEVTLEFGLVFSKNAASHDLLKKLDLTEVKNWARTLGFTTPIHADRGLYAGASCTRLDELTRSFGIFARNGRDLKLRYIRRVFDRHGNTLEDHTHHYDPYLSASDRFDRLAATSGDRPKQAIAARTAFLTTKLLSNAVKRGFTSMVRRTGLHAAGKTGTANKTYDMTFVGFTSSWVTGVWMGDDAFQRTLGRHDAAYRQMVPMWASYMYRAAVGRPNVEIPWEVPEGVRPRDRGGRRGEQLERMELVYKKKPASEAAPLPEDG